MKFLNSDYVFYIGHDERYMRPADVYYLAGDSSKIQEELGWKRKISFEKMISKMVKNDIKLYKERGIH